MPPLLAIGGAPSLGALAGASFSRVATRVAAEVYEHCGRWIPEGQPERLSARLVEFFGSARAPRPNGR